MQWNIRKCVECYKLHYLSEIINQMFWQPFRNIFICLFWHFDLFVESLLVAPLAASLIHSVDKYKKGEPRKLQLSTMLKCQLHTCGEVRSHRPSCVCGWSDKTQKQIRQTGAGISSLACEPWRLQTKHPSALQHEIQGCRGGFGFLD